MRQQPSTTTRTHSNRASTPLSPPAPLQHTLAITSRLAAKPTAEKTTSRLSPTSHHCDRQQTSSLAYYSMHARPDDGTQHKTYAPPPPSGTRLDCPLTVLIPLHHSTKSTLQQLLSAHPARTHGQREMIPTCNLHRKGTRHAHGDCRGREETQGEGEGGRAKAEHERKASEARRANGSRKRREQVQQAAMAAQRERERER